MGESEGSVPVGLFGRAASTGSGALRSVGSRLLRLTLPPHCLACGIPVGDEGSLCTTCWSSFTLIERPFCEQLAIPFPHDPGVGALSPEAMADPPPFRRLRAVAVYDTVARKLVHGLKYNDHLELVTWMGRWMARAGAEVIADADVIVPVPLHPVRLWWRRFNQSAALALAIGKASGKPVEPMALRRVRATRRQVGLGPRERQVNVRGAFRVAERYKDAIAGRNVLLVDDVYTTGATAKAVTRLLKRAGAANVDVLVFARVARNEIGTIY
jgi:ComF family protein